MTCPAGGNTILTGTVVAATLAKFGAPDPIYNAVAFVPNQTVKPFGTKIMCESCEAQVIGAPLGEAKSLPWGQIHKDHQ